MNSYVCRSYVTEEGNLDDLKLYLLEPCGIAINAQRNLRIQSCNNKPLIMLSIEFTPVKVKH